VRLLDVISEARGAGGSVIDVECAHEVEGVIKKRAVVGAHEVQGVVDV
jgi:hypothetical protein